MRYAVFLALCLAAWSSVADEKAVSKKQVDVAIRSGLTWLAQQQSTGSEDAGSWRCRAYPEAVAAFAGLAFLANGHLPDKGEYGVAVGRSLRYIMNRTGPDGYVGHGQRSGMYTHAVCTLFGLSCLGMLSDGGDSEPGLAEWCGRSLKVITEAHGVRRRGAARGGWRYSPDTVESDVSVTSWMLATLHAARQCGFEPDESVIEEGLAYINHAFAASVEGDAGFLYRPGVSSRPEPGATGTAIFIKSLFEPRIDESTRRGLAFLSKHPPGWGGDQYHGYFYFVSFYMTQGMFQIGGSAWDTFAPRMKSVLVRNQSGAGHWPFPPDNAPQSLAAGQAYPTAMAVLILSLEKQYLPMYQRQAKLF